MYTSIIPCFRAKQLLYLTVYSADIVRFNRKGSKPYLLVLKGASLKLIGKDLLKLLQY